jgi:hypothetical protein
LKRVRAGGDKQPAKPETKNCPKDSAHEKLLTNANAARKQIQRTERRTKLRIIPAAKRRKSRKIALTTDDTDDTDLILTANNAENLQPSSPAAWRSFTRLTLSRTGVASSPEIRKMGMKTISFPGQDSR